jgi:hypothetical protein
MKLVMEAGGLAVFIDTEHKTNPDQVRAIIQNDKMYAEQCFHMQVSSLDMLLEKMADFCLDYSKFSPDGSVPAILFIDSLNGVTSDDSYDTRVTKGEVANNMDGARNAKSIQEEMKRFVPRHIAVNPIILILTNHQKQQMAMGGPPGAPPKFAEPGGSHKDFMYTWKLKLSKGSLDGKVTESYDFWVKLEKSALGKPHSYGMRVPVMSRYNADGQEFIDFDWNTALAELLSSKSVSKEILKTVMHFVRDGSKYSSNTLGLKDVSAYEMGEAIHNNPELVSKLQRQVLRIRIKRKFGIDVLSAKAAGAQTDGVVADAENHNTLSHMEDADDDQTDELPTLDEEENQDDDPQPPPES